MSLNHIIAVDRFYVSALECQPLGNDAFDPENPFEDIRPPAEAQRKSDIRLIDFVETVKPTDLTKLHVLRDGKPLSERADRILLHLFQHQIYHRGQVHAMLSGTVVKPPQLDEFFLGNKSEQAARKDDFAALSFSKTDIWEDSEK